MGEFVDKGARVTITDGRQGKGESGTVFWKGPNKWGPGERLGVRGDNGETYWVADSDVEIAKGAAPPPPTDPGPTFAKGDRVAFMQNGNESTGQVFWIGESRSGPGQRLGVREDGTEETVWLDARQAKPSTDAPRSAMPDGAGPSHAGDDEGEIPWTPPLGEDDLPPAAPWDDGDVAAWSEPDESEGPPSDW